MVRVEFNCKNCKQRYPGCHDVCPDFAEKKKQVESIKKQQRIDAIVCGFLRDSHYRIEKYINKK